MHSNHDRTSESNISLLVARSIGERAHRTFLSITAVYNALFAFSSSNRTHAAPTETLVRLFFSISLERLPEQLPLRPFYAALWPSFSIRIEREEGTHIRHIRTERTHTHTHTDHRTAQLPFSRRTHTVRSIQSCISLCYLF